MCTVSQFIDVLQRLPQQDQDIRIVLKKNASIRSLLSGSKPKKVIKNPGQRPVNRTVEALLATDEVQLPEHIRSRFQVCINNTDNFWTTTRQSDLFPGAQRCQENAFGQYFQAALACAEDQTWQAITLRFLMLFFHDVKLLHNIQHLRDLVPQAVSTLQTLTGLAEDVIQSYFEKWCHGATIYHALAERLGIGVLFLLPERISKWMWEKELPKKGKYFEQTVERLRVIGILEQPDKQDADVLGERLRQEMIEPFRFVEHEMMVSKAPIPTNQSHSPNMINSAQTPINPTSTSNQNTEETFEPNLELERVPEISNNTIAASLDAGSFPEIVYPWKVPPLIEVSSRTDEGYLPNKSDVWDTTYPWRVPPLGAASITLPSSLDNEWVDTYPWETPPFNEDSIPLRDANCSPTISTGLGNMTYSTLNLSSHVSGIRADVNTLTD